MIHARLLQKGDGFNGILSDQVVLVMTRAECRKLIEAVDIANGTIPVKGLGLPGVFRKGRYKPLVAALAEVEVW